MAQTTIKVKCTDQMLEFIESPIVASGGFNEDKVMFEFCPLWDGFTKTAVFYVKKEETYEALLDEESTCVIPHEVLQNPGKIFFGVFGVNKDNVTRTSETVKYKIVQGAIAEDAKPSDPTPDIYEQLIAMLSSKGIGITSIEESDEDGGSNVVTFSTGQKLTVKNGKPGSNGEDGADGKDGANGRDGADGKDGADGRDGASITVIKVDESEEDSGENVVTFSDGNTLTVKNGSKGDTPTVSAERTDTGTVLTITDKNGTQNVIINDGIKGADGAGTRDITANVSVLADGYAETVTKAVDNGNTIVILCSGTGEYLTISISGHNGIVVGGYISTCDNNAQALSNCFGANLSEGFFEGGILTNGEYAIVIYYTGATEARELLPDVTETDNGKILQVVNGTWAAVEIPFAEGTNV